MNPVLWIAFFLILSILLNLKRIAKWIGEQRRIAKLVGKIDGPETIPVFGAALNFSPDSEKSTYQMEKYFRTFTEDKQNIGLMRLQLGPKPIIIVYKAETIKTVLESSILTSKPAEYDFMFDWLGEGLLTSKEAKWVQRRKMLTPAFHFAIVSDFVQTFNQQANVFVENMSRESDHGYPFDLYPYLKAVALDIICEAAMGVKMNAQRGKNMSYVKSVKAISELMWLRIRSPWFWPKPIWYLTGNGRKLDAGLHVVKTFTQNVIADRKQLRKEQKQQDFANGNTQREKQRRPAFLDLMLDMQEEKNLLSDADIREEVDTIMFEGHDTVSNTMSFLMIMVGHRMEIQEKIHDELREIFADNLHRDITVEDISKMKYLDMVIRETMRMFPVVPLIGRVISEDTKIGDFLIPKGVTAMIAPFSAQRDRRFYKDPDTFNPELHFSQDATKSRDPFAYVPFSAGPRNCIGQRFAWLEMKIVLGKFFREFKVVCDLHEIENRGLPELILRPSRGTPVRVERRIPVDAAL